MTRGEQILKMIVEHFVKTAQPVGSQTLLEEYGLEYSSATIRAEMNSLEKEGYLEKPHTSAGRVPSSKGYQYYAEHLRDERLDATVKYAIQSVLEKKAQSVEEVIRQSCEILANMTNLASVVLGPKVSEEHLVSVQIIPLGGKTATAVFVTDQGYVENKTFLIDEKMTIEDVQKTVGLLNERLSGTAISDLVPKMEAMKPALSDYLIGQDTIYQAILEAFLRFAGERMNLYGKSNLLEQPEFAEDAKKLRQVLSLLDDPNALRKAMETSISDADDNVKVAIGSEEEGLKDVSIVTANIQIPGRKNASISLVGPTRMDYDKAMEMLDYVSSTLDDYFNNKEGDESSWKKKETKKKQANATKATPKSKKTKK